jgi:hypothetical protein
MRSAGWETVIQSRPSSPGMMPRMSGLVAGIDGPDQRQFGSVMRREAVVVASTSARSSLLTATGSTCRSKRRTSPVGAVSVTAYRLVSADTK